MIHNTANYEQLKVFRSVLEKTHASSSDKSNPIHHYAFKGVIEDIRITGKLLRNFLDNDVFDTSEGRMEAEAVLQEISDLEKEFAIEHTVKSMD